MKPKMQQEKMKCAEGASNSPGMRPGNNELKRFLEAPLLVDIRGSIQADHNLLTRLLSQYLIVLGSYDLNSYLFNHYLSLLALHCNHFISSVCKIC